jgi:hypothetical protein
MSHRLLGLGVPTFICCFLFTSSPVAAEWQLEYGQQVREVASSQNEEERESTLSDSEVIVGVGDDYFYIEEGGEKRIFTFDTRRIAYVQPAQKTYQDTSLFSMVAIRSAEFHNRLGLGRIFEAAQIGEGQNPFNRFELEALFGIEDEDKEGPQVEEHVEDGVHRYVVNGEAIVQCWFGDTEVPGRYKGMYDKFVLYETHIHPAIRRKILSHANVIERLEYQNHDRPQASYEVQLELRASGENEQDGSIIQTHFVAGAMPSDSQRAADLDAIIQEILLETAGRKEEAFLIGPPSQHEAGTCGAPLGVSDA